MSLQFEQPFQQLIPDENVAERFEIRSISTPQQSYQPGGDVTVTVEYGSSSGQIPTSLDTDTDHPDYCVRDGFGFTPGADLLPVVSISDGTTVSGNGGCWDPSNTDSVLESITVAAPYGTSTADVTVELVGRTTGRAYSSSTTQIQVSQQAEKEPDRPQDSNQNQDQGGSQGIEIPGVDLPFVTDAQAVGGIVALLLLLYLLAAAG